MIERQHEEVLKLQQKQVCVIQYSSAYSQYSSPYPQYSSVYSQYNMLMCLKFMPENSSLGTSLNLLLQHAQRDNHFANFKEMLSEFVKTLRHDDFSYTSDICTSPLWMETLLTSLQHMEANRYRYWDSCLWWLLCVCVCVCVCACVYVPCVYHNAIYSGVRASISTHA